MKLVKSFRQAFKFGKYSILNFWDVRLKIVDSQFSETVLDENTRETCDLQR